MFNSKNFSVMAYANGFTMWSYTTSDLLTAVKAAGYFNETAQFARAGDMIMISSGMGASVAGSILVVTKIENGVVTVVGLTA